MQQRFPATNMEILFKRCLHDSSSICNNAACVYIHPGYMYDIQYIRITYAELE